MSGEFNDRSPGSCAAWCMAFGASYLCVLPSSALDGPLTPEESLRCLMTEPGLRVELVAAEPVVVSPVAVAWDERGRMFVVEDPGYPVGPGKGRPPVGQIVMLEDMHGDGHYDKRTVFADGLTFPNGIMPWAGGVYVTCAPDLYYFKDTDGDGIADLKEVVFTGFQDLSTTQLRVSHPLLNLDNWVYLTSGLTAARVSSPGHPERPTVFLNRVDGRFRPGTVDLEETGGTAQFGQTFDRFGRKFVCSNRNHIEQVVLEPRYAKRNPNFSFSQVMEDIPDHGAACRVYPLSANITTAASHAGYFTSACGLMIYEGDLLPQAYRGNSFTCEPAGNLVHRDVLAPAGVTFSARRAFPTNEFLASPDNWFRPVNLATGPDGALYVCDMYRKTIEHPDYLPDATRKVTDFESGKNLGRIYRIVPESGKAGRPKLLNFAKASSEKLVALYNQPDLWRRITAQRLLLERRDSKAVPALRRLCGKAKAPETRLHALRTLEALRALTDEDILRALDDPEPALREHGLQLGETRAANSPRITARLLALSEDPDPRVRFQCALTLGELTTADIVPALVRIATRDVDDKWTRAAILTSITHREVTTVTQILAANLPRERNGLPQMMEDLARVAALAAPKETHASLLTEMLASTNLDDLPWQMAATAGFGEALRSRGPAGPGQSALAALATEPAMDLGKALNRLFECAGKIAADAQVPLSSRLAAVSLLGEGGSEAAEQKLVTLLEPRHPAELQSAAVRALSRRSDTSVGAAFVTRERWDGYSPAVRDAVLSVLMVNTNFLRSLFTAIESGDVPAWTVNADRRGQLMKHKDAAIRDEALALFKDLTPGDRMKAYDQAKTVLALKPDSRNGRAVFQKNCVACHTFAGEGHNVGPDLTGIRNQPAEVLLLHIVVPEYEIMPVYTCYNVETKSGEGFTGLLTAETPISITLKMAQGLERLIPRNDIASLATSRLSLMPQELEKAMSPQELADLLAFLKGQ